jgi:sporulation protein YlmC with PRC-barrel domain
MLRSLKDIQGYTIRARDGEVGKVYNFYFDDEIWIIRYLVVDTGSWLPGRKVLIAPIAFEPPNRQNKTFSVKLTREQVKNSPDIDMDKPISRQRELSLHEHYAWPYLDRLGGGLFDNKTLGMGPETIVEMIKTPEISRSDVEEMEKSDPHLQNSRELLGYHIQAQDGKIGYIDDFILNDETWVIRYLVIDTGNWLPGRKVLISPFWINEIVWAGSTAHLDLTQEAVKNSPEYDPSAPIQPEYEQKLQSHYNRSIFLF